MSEHIDPEQGLTLVALAETDPELEAARAHAADCAACRALLEQSTMLLSLVDEQLFAEAGQVRVSPALKARVERKVFGRRKELWSWLMVAGVAALSFMLALEDSHTFGELVPALGVRCVAFESGYALVPLVVGGLLTRFGAMRLSVGRFASYTMTFAVFGQILLRSRCEAHDLGVHLFAFHFLAVLAWGAIGAGTARWLAARTT